jgi:hypothetical protein
MPPSLKLGIPILIDLNTLPARASAQIIKLDQVRNPPGDAIVVDELDPLTVLIAGTRRKVRR